MDLMNSAQIDISMYLVESSKSRIHSSFDASYLLPVCSAKKTRLDKTIIPNNVEKTINNICSLIPAAVLVIIRKLLEYFSTLNVRKIRSKRNILSVARLVVSDLKQFNTK